MILDKKQSVLDDLLGNNIKDSPEMAIIAPCLSFFIFFIGLRDKIGKAIICRSSHLNTKKFKIQKLPLGSMGKFLDSKSVFHDLISANN